MKRLIRKTIKFRNDKFLLTYSFNRYYMLKKNNSYYNFTNKNKYIHFKVIECQNYMYVSTKSDILKIKNNNRGGKSFKYFKKGETFVITVPPKKSFNIKELIFKANIKAFKIDDIENEELNNELLQFEKNGLYYFSNKFKILSDIKLLKNFSNKDGFQVYIKSPNGIQYYVSFDEDIHLKKGSICQLVYKSKIKDQLFQCVGIDEFDEASYLAQIRKYDDLSLHNAPLYLGKNLVEQNFNVAKTQFENVMLKKLYFDNISEDEKEFIGTMFSISDTSINSVKINRYDEKLLNYIPLNCSKEMLLDSIIDIVGSTIFISNIVLNVNPSTKFSLQLEPLYKLAVLNNRCIHVKSNDYETVLVPKNIIIETNIPLIATLEEVKKFFNILEVEEVQL